MVEHNLAKVGVESSNLFARSKSDTYAIGLASGSTGLGRARGDPAPGQDRAGPLSLQLLPLGRRLAAAFAVLVIAVSGAAHAASPSGFLNDTDLADTRWLPPTPAPDGAIETADLAIYLGTRSLVAGPRGTEAHLDDVYNPPDVAPRFADALGVTLTPANALIVLNTIHLAQADLEVLVAPVKKPVAAGGRVRPYVQFAALPACPHDVDDSQFGLNTSGSYPSTHAGLGMLWALILSELAPDRTDAVFAKGYQFGESRLVCGFHYPSDLAGGRLAATVLFAKLETSKAFQDQMAAAKAQLDALRGLATAKSAALVQKTQKVETQRVLPTLKQTQ